MIGVKNNLKEKIPARYDGQDFTFEPAVTRALSEDAARHIFGYGEKDKTRALLRLGWIPNGADKAGALEKLNEIQFLAVEEPKFKDEPVSDLPRSVAQAEDGPRPLTAEEAAQYEKDVAAAQGKPLAHQGGSKTKQFGK